jgi:LytS/YehU family sensor histidine kinase
MQIRFQGKLTVEVHVPEDTMNALVPNLILQPIVENAIKHGVGRTGGGRIAISARRDGELLEIVVADDGAGPGGGAEGVGLSNTNARLAELYGARHHVELRPDPAGGTAAVLTAPFHTSPVARP